MQVDSKRTKSRCELERIGLVRFGRLLSYRSNHTCAIGGANRTLRMFEVHNSASGAAASSVDQPSHESQRAHQKTEARLRGDDTVAGREMFDQSARSKALAG